MRRDKFGLRLLFLLAYILLTTLTTTTIGNVKNTYVNPYQAMMPQKSLSKLDNMISMCFRSICKEWMHECHWYCDTINNPNAKKQCMDCLSYRGGHCLECFDL